MKFATSWPVKGAFKNYKNTLFLAERFRHVGAFFMQQRAIDNSSCVIRRISNYGVAINDRKLPSRGSKSERVQRQFLIARPLECEHASEGRILVCEPTYCDESVSLYAMRWQVVGQAPSLERPSNCPARSEHASRRVLKSSECFGRRDYSAPQHHLTFSDAPECVCVSVSCTNASEAVINGYLGASKCDRSKQRLAMSPCRFSPIAVRGLPAGISVLFFGKRLLSTW